MIGNRRKAAAVLAMLMIVGVGCGSDEPKLYKVVGTVMLDGEPLPNAEIRFLPIVQGDEPVRPSSAMTDENGEYSLEYSSTRSGARPGKYRVYVTTERDAMPEVPAVAEVVPKVYNRKTTLTAEIDDDQRMFNFYLDSTAGDVVAEPAP